jgi:hypothetical protein
MDLQRSKAGVLELLVILTTQLRNTGALFGVGRFVHFLRFIFHSLACRKCWQIRGLSAQPPFSTGTATTGVIFLILFMYFR